MKRVVPLLRCATLVCAAVAPGGCQSQSLPSPAVVVSLRLFDLTTDTPDVAPGTDVTVRAQWFDGSAHAPRAVHFLWRICPEGSDHEPRACLSPADGSTLAEGDRDDTVTVPSTALTLPAGASQATWFVFLALCPDQAAMYDPSAGQWVCPSQTSLAPDDREGVQAVRRITVRTDGRLNHDPSVAQVTVGGRSDAVTVPHCVTGADGAPCPTVALTMIAGDGSIETDDEGLPETLLASFFVTAGSVSRPRATASDGNPLGMDGSLSTQWTPPTAAGPAKLWFSLRDGRGGNVLREVDVTVR